MALAEPHPNRVRVSVLGGDPIARRGLRAVLGDQPSLDASDAAPDVIVWDLVGAVGGEPEETPAHTAPLLALVGDEHVARDALDAGARGVLLRDGDGERLAAAALAIAHGMTVIDQPFVATVVGPPRVEHTADTLVEPLTPRELDVLALLAEGLSNRKLAGQLGISEHTVKFHVNGILAKLDARSRTDAVVRAARLGLLTL